MATLDADFLTRPIAHRGLHDPDTPRIENSRAAVRAAVEAGYGVEIDIQMARCGTPMVFHDDTLDRLTDMSGPVATQDAPTLTRLQLARTRETIPSLADIMALVDARVPLLVEIKDQSRRLAPVDGRLEAGVCALLRDYRGPVALMSFNPHSIEACLAAAPEIARGLTTTHFRREDWPGTAPVRCETLNAIADFDPLGACFISHDHHALTMPRVAQLKRQGAAILCWTVRSEEEDSNARQFADNVTFEGYLPPLNLSQRD